MTELNDKIARLEMRIEQYVIHLRLLAKDSPDAANLRNGLLLKLLHELRFYQDRRQQMEDGLAMDEVAV